MFGSNFLDVAIGLTLFFLFASLMVSAAREGIAQYFKARASDLERGLRNLFADPHGTDVTQKFFDHPRINALFLGKYDPSQIDQSKTGGELPREHRGRLPSYIPAEQFSTTIMDIVAGAGRVARTGVLTAQELRAAAQAFPNQAVKTAILSALDAAEDDLTKAREGLERWFNDAMERAGGWYKQRTQIILFWLGVLAAVAFNLDALDVAAQLQGSAALRDAMIGHAQALSQMPQVRDLDDAIGQFGGLGFAVGWHDCTTGSGGFDPTLESCALSQGVIPVLKKLAGWFITALAVTLGAPFWFDLLNKFMSLRSAIKPKDEQEESKKTQARATAATAAGAAAAGVAAAGEKSEVEFSAHQWAQGDAEEGVL